MPTSSKTARGTATRQTTTTKPGAQAALFDLAAEDPALELRRTLGGHAIVAGLDEAGRGPLAGPVVAAACVLPDPLPPPLAALDDSKKLSEEERERLYPLIVEHATAWGVASVEAPRIDEVNILRASLEAMADALMDCERRLAALVSGCVLDGNQRAPLPPRVVQRCVVGGDALSRPVMAASILAKVTRDRRMVEEHGRYPGYGFDAHKGYGTPQHLRALRELGPTPIHRRSFAPVRDSMDKHDPAKTTTAKGRRGEDLAVIHLEREGYVILGRNVRTSGGEIDIVAQDGKVLCFVEVRTRARASSALESVDTRKRARIVRAAVAYLHALSSSPPCRFDVIAVSGGRVHLVQNAFEATSS